LLLLDSRALRLDYFRFVEHFELSGERIRAFLPEAIILNSMMSTIRVPSLETVLDALLVGSSDPLPFEGLSDSGSLCLLRVMVLFLPVEGNNALHVMEG
jgi:hypothetical protein